MKTPIPANLRWQPALFVVAALFVLIQSSNAQTVTFRSPVSRVTVQAGAAATFGFTNSCKTSALVNPVDLTISGLPSGVTATITDTNGNALPVDGGFPSTLISTNLLITLTVPSTVPAGIYPLSLNGANGAINNWSFDLQVAAVWSGADYLSGANTNWNDGGNWFSGSAPGASDDVVFGQNGATNSTAITNVIIQSSTTISSLRFAPTNSTFKTFAVLLNSGVTLGVAGNQGFSVMKDNLNVYTALGGINLTMTGGGALAVTNELANFSSYVDNQNAYTLDFSGLGNLTADVNRFGLADYSLFPNYRNLNDLNAYNGQPRSAIPTVLLARTNVIKAIFADPYNYTNADSRHYGFSYMQASELSGSSTVPIFSLGISNIFYVDGVCFIGANSRGTVQFNTGFTASNAVAIFRGTNGGRMTMFAESDGGGTNTANSNLKGTVNFGGGTLDMLVDQFYIGRDRKLILQGGTPNYQGNFYMGKGTVDANTVILGYRQYNSTNTGAYSGYCEGTVSLTNGIFRVNNSLTLGSTVCSDLNGLGTGANTEYGYVSVGSGGTLMANMIYVGGPVYGASKNNFIVATNNGILSISNYCGSSQQMLDSLTINNGSQLIINLSATSTVPVIYATNYITTTGPNSLTIVTMKNPGSLVNNLLIPLFKRGSGQSFPTFNGGVVNLSGVNGQIVHDTDVGGSDTDLQDFQVLLSTPKNLLWRGYSGTTWDTTTANWLDLNTGLHTNFVAGDNVFFDDLASQFNIDISSSAVILPGTMNMTNNVNAYTFNNNSGGSIIGSSTLSKYGTQNLQVDCPSSIGVALNQGTLTGAGSIGSATIGSGTVMNFSNAISGGLTCSGVATMSAAGTVGGIVSVSGGGILTNFGTMSASFGVSSNGLFVNNVSASLAAIASSSVNVGGKMINRGNISGANLTIGGTFEDTGEGGVGLTTTFTANSGSTIIPGGDGIGTTTISPVGGVGFPGRVLLSQGSTNLFKVNAGTLASTKLLSGYQDYGGSSINRSQNGCTIVITNVSLTPFAAGQQFTLFQYSGGGAPFSTGSSTNTYPVISPATPGSGLAWDLTKLWPNGVIGVINANIGLNLTNSFTVSSSNIVAQFSWDPAYLGYRLQTQANPLSVGLSNNWSNAGDGTTNLSWVETSISITNSLTTNAVFYRLTFP
jgi:hypothetical protein